MSTRRISFYRMLPLASLLLAACQLPYGGQADRAGPAKSQSSPEWLAHQHEVSRVTQYQTRGSFAYISGSQKVYARFNWQQTGADRYRLLLTNPLGSTEMDLNVKPGLTELTNNQGKKYISDNPQEMIQKLTGMDIPLKNLRQWMLGLPGDASEYSLDSHGYLSRVSYTQGNNPWVVTYQGYHDDTIPPLPSNMELKQDDRRIKLKMDSWSVK